MDAVTAALAGLVYQVGRFGNGPNRDRSEQDTSAARSASFAAGFIPQTGLAERLTEPAIHALMALADRLAAGEPETSGAPQSGQTLSPLAGLKGNAARAYWPLTALELDEDTVFAGKTPMSASDIDYAYSRLRAEFLAEAARLEHLEDSETLLGELLGMMERWMWSVPADTGKGRAGVSLYDHGRVMAAVAACLSALEPEVIEAQIREAAQARSNTTVAVLLRGDISGIQRFIYTITSRGATPSLRGRSFFLQLLTEAIARWILRQLGLPITNLIYAGGGHFDLLVAAGHEARLAKVQERLEAILLDQFDGDLYVALGAAPLSQAALRREAFHKHWQAASRALNRQKGQRFANSAEQLFNARGTGGGAEVECQVCHHEGDDVIAVERNDNRVYQCELCRSLETLGKDLRGAAQLAVAEVPEEEAPGERTWNAVLRRFGMAVSIQREDSTWALSVPDAIRGCLFGLRDYPTPEDADEANWAIQAGIVLSRRQRFSVNVAPRLPNRERATFGDLQNASMGLKRLGVLRMDVDNLGSLFATGIQQKGDNGGDVNAATLARVASLSSALSRFFEGWVGVLAGKENAAAAAQEVTEPVYTIYSGGDDLFIVGAWDAMVRLAVQIHDDFMRYASSNPHVTLSAGISLHGGKEPLYQAAESAREALEEAKSMDGKNAIHFLGHSLHWDEFEALSENRDLLLGFLNQNVDRSVLRVLMELDAQRQATVTRLKLRAKTKTGDPQTAWGPYMWRGAYLLRRFADRTKGPVRDEFHKYVDGLSGSNFREIQKAAQAARWVDALTRKEKDHE